MSNPTIDSKKFGPHNYADEGTSDCGHGCGSCHNALIGINPEAVPDLLAALKKYVGKFGNCGDVYAAGRAAIAKAEGGEK